MTPEEQALELGKEFIKQTLAPVQEIVLRIAGGAASEIGLMARDSLRAWRFKNAIRLFHDVQQFASESHLELKPVAPRLLFPILDAATLNENEELHRKWVALLANAATSDEILPSFPEILKQMTPDEARTLDRYYDLLTSNEPKDQWRTNWGRLGPVTVTTQEVKVIVIEKLERLALISWTPIVGTGSHERGHLYITQLGEAFIRACRWPKKPL